MKHLLLTLGCASLGLVLAACVNEEYVFPEEPQPIPPQLPCNGHPELCDRRYDEVAYASTHNSFNYEFGATQFLFPNQDYPVLRQLQNGIRCIMLDVYDDGGTLILRHGPSLIGLDLGHENLSVVLNDIRSFLESNPREVVSIIFESEVEGARFEQAFAQAGLLDYVHTQDFLQPWPTLKEMIDSGRRLVVYTENENQGGSPAWFHYAWRHIQDTPYTFASRSEFTESLNRGMPENPVLLLNHWISTSVLGVNVGVGNADSAAAVNAEAVLLARARACWRERGHIPNFVAVDYYNRGDVVRVVNALNGVQP